MDSVVCDMVLRRLSLVVAAVAGLATAASSAAAAPQPGTPEYLQRDLQNMRDAYGRQTAPGGQVDNSAYLPGLVKAGTQTNLAQFLQQAQNLTRPAITPGEVVPGWNVGNPLRDGWNGTRGRSQAVSWTNRYGALIHGHVWAPLAGKGPYPGVVITTGSVQGSEGMYAWLAQDLAERGYLVLTYDVQGQGTSETLPHDSGPVDDLPFCNPFAAPRDIETLGCPGVPAQQASNFVHGTQDALDFFLSTPKRPYPNPAAGSAQVDRFNPWWRLFDRSRDRASVTPGRTTRVAIIGHSLGAFAVSYVQGVDPRVETVVALDKLTSGSTMGVPEVTPVVPALAVQSDYGFTVQPYFLNGGSSLSPTPTSPTQAPDPQREIDTGFAAWRAAGIDSMLIVPRASTHLEYTDIPLALPASRYGQATTSVYVQAWLDRYLKHDPGALDRLLAPSHVYDEPVGDGRWEPVTLDRDSLLSRYFCSGWSLAGVGSQELCPS